MSDGFDDFDWEADDDIALVCQEQPRSAVYWNPRGQVVIRQMQTGRDDEDEFLVFSVENLPALIEALQWKLIEAGVADEVVDRPEHATPAQVRPRLGVRQRSPGAERQRRYRQRHSNDAPVTGDAPGDAGGGGSVTLFDRAAE